jgi:hypothetical protein
MKTKSRILLPVVLMAAMLMSTVSIATAGELLIVSALSEDSIAAPNNRLPNYIVVSVTTADGTPMTGLTATNFKVDPIIVAPGGALVNITDVRSSRLPGFYQLQVVPISTQTWKAGVYIFAVSVTQGVKNGQALTSVTMD